MAVALRDMLDCPCGASATAAASARDACASSMMRRPASIAAPVQRGRSRCLPCCVGLQRKKCAYCGTPHQDWATMLNEELSAEINSGSSHGKVLIHTTLEVVHRPGLSSIN